MIKENKKRMLITLNDRDEEKLKYIKENRCPESPMSFALKTLIEMGLKENRERT